MFRAFRYGCLVFLVALVRPIGFPEAAPRQEEPKRRDFLLTYQATVTGLLPGQAARIWLPVPPTNEDQEVAIVRRELPAEPSIGREAKYGNQILFVEARSNEEGKIALAVTYRVKRMEVRAASKKLGSDTRDEEIFLKPDAKVPVSGQFTALLQNKTLPEDQEALGRLLYEVVNGHMRYGKEGAGWGQGDTAWACEKGCGNCSDFHSLFISLARSQKIPAKFEIGFPLPEKRGLGEIPGYHCWAWFKPNGGRWVPVDISEAKKNPRMKDYYFGNLTEDRVVFTVGRDLTLVPRQEGAPLNFFVYPYVEVDGKPYPEAKVSRRFTYQDVETDRK